MNQSEIRILLLDDEAESLAFSLKAIAQFVPEDRIFPASTVEEAVCILKTETVSLAFLDIELTHSNGFELCEYIHREYPSVCVVILTGHVDLGAKSYDYEPFDFLVKPVDILRMGRTFDRFYKSHKQDNVQKFAIETKNGIVLVDIADIVYIEKSGSSCKIYLTDKNVHTVTYTLDKLELMLAEKNFFRTHQSYLVPTERIVQVCGSKLGSFYEAKLNDGTLVPVSRNKYAKLKDHIILQSMKLM